MADTQSPPMTPASQRPSDHKSSSDPSSPSFVHHSYHAGLIPFALTGEQFQQLLAMVGAKIPTESQANATAGGIRHHTQEWIVDSGATDHITALPLSQSVPNKSFPPLKLPTGERVSISNIGNFNFDSKLSLTNVLRMASFFVNLISVSRLTKSLRCSITFFPDFYILQDLETRTLIGWGKQRNGLYHITNPATPPPTCPRAFSVFWHQRLGHPSPQRLQLLAKQSSEVNFHPNKSCDVCPLAKQTRMPFPSSNISSTHSFALIHCDI